MRHRINSTLPRKMNLKMRVRPGAITCAAHIGDLLTLRYFLPFVNENATVVRVKSHATVRMLDFDHVSIATRVPPASNNDPSRGCNHWRTHRSRNIDSLMQTAPAVTKPRGQDPFSWPDVAIKLACVTR